VNPSGVQTFVGIDVPDACEDRLVEERRLDRPSSAGESVEELVSSNVESVWPERVPHTVKHFTRVVGRKSAKSSRIAKHQPPRLRL
jgi:hypothetical protein